ncbi:TPA: YPDG domain-containing protein, partial [Streptococcus suis]|nr:YPDG domain-containing protein [Streptococcus suis]
MSNRDKNMFRNEQRFSFRKYSFGLASALIANVVFGATIAGGPVVHANTETEAATVTSTSNVQSETVGSTEPSVAEETVATPVVRNVSLTYTVKVVDQEGAVLRTEVKTVDATTGEEVASVLAELSEDLVPTDYKLIAGLGQVRVVENQDNVFTVTVEKVVAKQISETPTATASENAISSEVSVTETSETAISSEASSTEISLASSEAPVEVIASSETSVAPAIVKVTESVATNTSNLSSLALLAYEVHYTDTEGQVVGKTAGLVTAESKDGVATKQVNFTAKDVPSGYELALGQSQVLTKQLVENQINILSFAVVKKSEEEEIAESQLAHKDVLEQVTSEADLLADEALRQVAKEQAGNTSLENAAIATKETAKEAQVILNDASATQEVVDATVETVKASTSALADEMLKVDEDGNITAQLSVESSDTVFSNAANTSYIVADSQDLNTAGEHLKISQEVSGDIQTGQTSTWTLIFNEGNPATGYGHQLTRASTHKFGIGNDVVGDINIQTYERSDANGMWVLVDSTTQRDWTSTNRQYYANKAFLADYKQVLDNNGEGNNSELSTIHNIGNTSPAEAFHTFQRTFGHTTRQFKFVVTAKIREGRDASNVAFWAGNDPGSKRNRYFSATPAKVDPVTISDIAGGQSSVTITPQEIAERIEVKVKDQNVVLERQADGTYNATTNAANVTVATNTATGAYTPTITLTLPNGTTFAEGDKVRSQSSIADASQINNSGLNRSGTEYDQLISSDQGRQYSVITEKTITPATPVVEKTDQYNITWDNQSVAGRSDAGFEWAQDANGNKVLVYKYDLDNTTAFTTNEVLVQLNASATGLRTLDGTEKALIENADANDGYTTEGNTAKLNGQTIDFLDVVNPNPLWGGRKVVDSTADTSLNLNNYNTTGNPTPDYSTFYVPGTTDPGTVTHSVQIGGTNGVGNITLTDNARDLYTNQVDRQKLYIRSVAASYQDGTGSAIDNDTDTDTIPVYFVGYRNPNQPTTATDKKPLYVFNNTAIKTVDPGTNVDTSTTDDKVNVVTLADPQDINSVAVTRETDVGTGVYNPASIGITIDTDGNASGTPAVGAIGVYSRGLTVTDGTGATTNLFPRNDEMETYVLDATAGATITKAVGESVTKAEILDNVTVATGNSNTMDAAIDSRYRKVLAPNQTVPNTPGEHTVIVRVITESNVYKDVPVTVVIPAPQKDGLTPAYAENVVAPGASATTPPTFTNADGQSATAPTGATYAIPSSYTPPTGYTATIDPSTGAVTLTAPTGATVETVEVPVTVTYSDKSTDTTTAVFKLDTDGDG